MPKNKAENRYGAYLIAGDGRVVIQGTKISAGKKLKRPHFGPAKGAMESEDNNNPVKAAEREIIEETGVRRKIYFLLSDPIAVYLRRKRKDGKAKRVHLYLVLTEQKKNFRPANKNKHAALQLESNEVEEYLTFKDDKMAWRREAKPIVEWVTEVMTGKRGAKINSKHLTGAQQKSIRRKIRKIFPRK